MSTQIAVSKKKINPADIARDVMGTIKKIEEAINGTNTAIGNVEKRGFLKNLVSSSRDDLIALSKSQTKINDLMLGMIQEIITLNVMSYSFLAGVIDEFRQMTRDGWKDNDGRLQRLSQTGKDFADSASKIFVKIVEGSRTTQQAIELNKEQIEELRFQLAQKDEIDALQSRQLASINRQIEKKSELIGKLSAGLAQKALVDERQSRELAALGRQLVDNAQQVSQLSSGLAERGAVDERQSRELEALAILLEEKAEQLGHLSGSLAEKALVDERQSREIESTNILLQDASGHISRLNSEVAQKTLLDGEQTRQLSTLDAMTQELARRQDTLETRLQAAAAPMATLTRKLVMTAVISALVSAGVVTLLLRALAQG